MVVVVVIVVVEVVYPVELIEKVQNEGSFKAGEMGLQKTVPNATPLVVFMKYKYLALN